MANMFKAAGQAMTAKVGAKKAQMGDIASSIGDLSKQDIEDLLRDRLLSGGGGGGGMTDMSSSLRPMSMRQATPPMYDPANLYGRMYRAYGGRGGLLGED